MLRQILFLVLCFLFSLAYNSIDSCEFAINGALIVDQVKFYDYGFYTGRFNTNSASGITIAFGIYDFETE